VFKDGCISTQFMTKLTNARKKRTKKIKELVSNETVVLCRWESGTQNCSFVN